MQREYAVGIMVFTATLWACSGDSTKPDPPPAAAQVTITPNASVLSAIGDTVRMIAQVRDTDGQLMPNATLTWSATPASVASIDNVGLVTALGVGGATVSAVVTGTGVSGSVALTVTQVISAVAVMNMPDSLLVGATADLAAEAKDANGHAIAGAAFTWSTSDAAVATVTAQGVVTAIGRGAVAITATAGAVAGADSVSVFRPNVTVAADTALSGDVHVRTFTVPAGVTITASTGLSVLSDDGVSIAGELVGDCVPITIKAGGPISVTGTLSTACTDSAATGGPLEVIAEGTVALLGDIESGGGIYVTNDATLTADDFEPRPNFDAGGVASLTRPPTIPVRRTAGVVSAAGTSNELACELKGRIKANPGPGADFVQRCRGDVRLGPVNIQVADGRAGAAVTVQHALEAVATGRDGEAGSWLQIQATGVIIASGLIELKAGSGGAGGDATATGAAIGGTPQRAAGAVATGGNGGRAGAVLLSAVDGTPILNIYHGTGGLGGSASARGAAGRVADAAPAQAGGNARATGGTGGAGVHAGEGGEAFATGGLGGAGSAQHPDGADGGSATSTGGSGGEALEILGRAERGGSGGFSALLFGNGGAGYGTCEVAGVAGGRGGNGGPLSARPGVGGAGAQTGARGKVTLSNAGNGGNGGAGTPPGAGGAASSAENVDAAADLLSSMKPGQPGNACPPPQTGGIDVSVVNIVGHHTIGATPCPTPLGSTVITNTGTLPIDWSAAEIGGIDMLPSQGTLGPGEQTTALFGFDCSVPYTIDGSTVLVATAGISFIGEIVMFVYVEVNDIAVVLDHTLGQFAAGSVIALSRITGDFYIGSHLGGCSNLDHLHGGPGGIYIDGVGPFADPNPPDCGYGLVGTHVVRGPPGIRAGLLKPNTQPIRRDHSGHGGDASRD